MVKKTKIEIYGAGCDKFFQTMEAFRQTARSLPGAWEVEAVTDPKTIAAHGPMNLPAVFINGKRVLEGQGVSRKKAEALFLAAGR